MLEDLAQTLIEYGADKVLVVDNARLEIYDTEAYAQVFKAIIDAKNLKSFYSELQH